MEFEPVPAITGIFPLHSLTATSIIFLCSSWDNVGDSPVVPPGTTPFVPFFMKQVTSERRLEPHDVQMDLDRTTHKRESASVLLEQFTDELARRRLPATGAAAPQRAGAAHPNPHA